MSKETLAEALFEIGAIRFGKFTLSSGKASSYYIDLRVIPSFPDVYPLVVGAYEDAAEKVGLEEFDAVAGLATAGVTISSPLSFLMKKPMIYVRSEEKGHGLGRRVEGAAHPGWKALIVDDLITTGGSVMSAAKALRHEGWVVNDAVVLVDRLEGGEANLRNEGIKLSSFINVKELVGVLHEMKKVTKTDYEAVLRQVGGGA